MTQNQLFNAVKAVLNEQSYHESIENPKEFFILSHENGLSGMIYSLLESKAFPENIYKAFEKDFYAYMAKDIKQLDLIKRLKDTLNNAKIKHIFLKGSHLKTLYPESYMRSMGDIDLLIEAKNIQTVKPVLEAIKFKRTLQSSAHDVYTFTNQLEVEVHPKITKEIDAKYDHFFKDAWLYAKKVNEYTYRLELEFELIYLLVHLIKHFHSSGVGLRSILDIGLFVSNYERLRI
ncbi:MAG: nucleotidyltransferase family protein [Candidatus Izemoplasmataceae bacterium]